MDCNVWLLNPDDTVRGVVCTKDHPQYGKFSVLVSSTEVTSFALKANGKFLYENDIKNVAKNKYKARKQQIQNENDRINTWIINHYVPINENAKFGITGEDD
jgi:hypothetical protein